MMRSTAILLSLLLCAATVSAQEFSNATVSRHDASRGVAAAVQSLPANGKVWVAWSVPMAAGSSICCYGDSRRSKSTCCAGCSLSKNGGWSMNDDIPGSGAMKIVARIESGVIQSVRLFEATCVVDGDGAAVHWLFGASEDSSIDYLVQQVPKARDEGSVIAAIAQHATANAIATLERLSAEGNREDVREHALFWVGQRGGERGFRFLRDVMRSDASTSLKKRAIFSLSQNSSENAVPELINVARRDASSTLRREALFWLGQKAGEKAAGELRRAVDEDPDDDVREHAVFAISQLPRERSVPLLIDLARTHKSRRVREKALFWLAQTGDSRALDVIEEILMK